LGDSLLKSLLELYLQIKGELSHFMSEKSDIDAYDVNRLNFEFFFTALFVSFQEKSPICRKGAQLPRKISDKSFGK
jgi:hypothetical protein